MFTAWNPLKLLRQSIHAKLLLFFLIVAILPLVLLGIVSYYKSADVINSQYGQYGQVAVTQLQSQIDANINQMQLIARDINMYFSTRSLTNLYVEEPKTYAAFLEHNELERFIKEHKLSDIKGIFIVTDSGYYFGENILDTGELFNNPWWQSIPDDYEGEFWVGFYNPGHYNKELEWENDKVLGLIVPVIGQPGIFAESRILIEMDARKLMDLFQLLEDDMRSNIQISDRNHQVIYETDSEFQPQADDVKWQKRLEANDWKIEIRIPHDQFYLSSHAIRSFTIILLAFSFVLALLLAYMFSSRVTHRIRRLNTSMHHVSVGKLDTRTKIDSADELGRLGFSFNNMVSQIRALIAENSRIEKLKKEVELQAIHYQINPHLLFNTLNSIQWKARLQGAEDIRLMLFHLTKVLEGNLDITRELIPLDEELKNIGHFLKIQEVRFGQRFTFSFESEGLSRAFLIPRMSLQPLFENIFFHGFEDGEGHIELTLRETGEELILTLRDDGRGIEEDRIPHLLNSGFSRKMKRGLGLFNVDQKFKLHFGYNYGLTIRSEKGKGTTIMICWPKKEGTIGEDSQN